jgi:hypothetical protein
MKHFKLVLASTFIALTLSQPAAAYTNNVMVTSIDHRLDALDREIQTLQTEYLNSPTSSRKHIKKRIMGLRARKAQLYTAKRRMSSRRNHHNHNSEYMIKYHRKHVASPSSPDDDDDDDHHHNDDHYDDDEDDDHNGD